MKLDSTHQKVPTWTLLAGETGQIDLGGDPGCIGSFFVVQVIPAGTFSMVPRRKIWGSSVANVAGSAPKATYYEDLNAGTTAISAGTAITAAGLYKIPSDQSNVLLDVTSNVSGCVIEVQMVNTR